MLEIISGKLRIAVIDDVEIQGQYLETMLRTFVTLDVEIEVFTEPKIALEEIRKGRYFAVFTDIHMDQMMGDDVVREINKMNLGVKTFVLTGDDGFIMALNCFRLGCRDIFLKPPKKKVIKKTMEKIEEDFNNWRNTFEEIQARKKKQA